MGSASDPFEVATAFLGDLLSGQTGLNSRYKIRKDSYTDANTGVTHVYVRQMVNGLEVADGDINLNIKDGMQSVTPQANNFHVLSRSVDEDELAHLVESNCAFVDLPYDLAPRALSPKKLLTTLALLFSNLWSQPPPIKTLFKTNVPDTVNPVKARLAYVQVPNKASDSTELNLVWKFEVEMSDNWYEAAVSAAAPHRIVSVVDWASDAPIPKPKPGAPATYNVFAWGINDPSEGLRSRELGRPELLDQQLPPEGHKGNVFDFPYDPQATNKTAALGEAKKFIDIAVTQLFYTSNLVHDLYYRYGFDEVAGNFQQHNFGRGGAENDAVIANAQDGSGFNNANFMTPPDGQNGRCRMYLWNTANPYRDGDLEAGIVIHELSHGLSTRLTGGPANSGCLGWGESGGMGEGWEDYSDYSMGSWAANREQERDRQPSTYKTLDKPGYWGVHAIGEVWAEILWVVSNGLIDVHGSPIRCSLPSFGRWHRSRGRFLPSRGIHIRWQEEAIDSQARKHTLCPARYQRMKLQPCRPSFFEARDAIIQADQILTGGENFCTLWTGFSKRGLGPDSRVDGRTPWGGGIRTDVCGFHFILRGMLLILCSGLRSPLEVQDGLSLCILDCLPTRFFAYLMFFYVVMTGAL
ncbi:Fungalysin/Thermolysin Extracellular metalloproteinase [Salix suchowensis]|nr:Fungalysin/Thermolysin Extracellular metalloproteinase [Salix suchowensis]